MFRKMLAFGLAALGLVVGVGQAAASTVTVSPGGPVTATATTASMFQFNTARRTIVCTTSAASGTLVGGSTAISADLVPAFSTCTYGPSLRPAFACGNSSLSVTGDTLSGVTPVSLTGINCTISFSAVCTVRLVGSFTGSYNNSSAQLTINSPSPQSLVAWGSTCAALPNDAHATFGAVGGGNLVYNISPAQVIVAAP